MFRGPTPETVTTLSLLLALAPFVASRGRRRFAAAWLCDGYRTLRRPR